MEYCIYEDIDKLDRLSISSSDQTSNKSYDISQVNFYLILLKIKKKILLIFTFK